MKKLLKRIFQISIFLTIFLIILVIGVTLFINPNQFKAQIEQQIVKQTGYHLSIQGPIIWRWFPMLALELNQIRLEALEPFKEPLMTSQSARAEAELLPLLSGKLLVSLQFDQPTLLLEKNAQGQGNWENLKTTSTPSENTEESSPSAAAHKAKFYQFVLNSIHVKNGQILFKNDAKLTSYKLVNLNLSAKNLFSNIFQTASSGAPVSLSFNLENAKVQSLGNVILSSQCAILSPDQINIQKLSIKFTTPDGTLTELTGEATVVSLQTVPLIAGRCETKNLNVHAWLKEFNMPVSPEIPSTINVKTSFGYKAARLKLSSFDITSKTAGDLSGIIDIRFGDNVTSFLSLKGNFASKQLKIGKIEINGLRGALTGENNVLTLTTFPFQFAGIPQLAKLQIDLRGANPQYSLKAESQGFEINQLLKFFNAKNKIEGKANYQVNLVTTGKNIADWRRNLSGQAHIEVTNGKFYGNDFIQLLKSAESNVYGLVSSLVNKQAFNIKNVIQSEAQKWDTRSSNASTKTFTPFNVAKLDATLSGGSINKSTLLIDHSEYKVTGDGTCNLNNFAIQYHLAASLKNNPYPANDKVAAYLYGVPLPVKVGGTLDNPTVRPDLDTYTRNAVTYAQKHLLQEMVEKGINKALEHLLKH